MNDRILDHVGIAVSSLDAAIPIWTSLIDAPPSRREVVESHGVEVVFIGSGPGRVELLAPTRSDSAIARFLHTRGPGLHHVCFRVPDIRSALVEHRADGFDPIDDEPRAGAGGHLVAFLHQRSSGGVLVELLQRNSDDPAVPMP